ncbi:MAG: hypothetical protein HOZ81_19935 [Streptomyces sp.]|nr:hypothetical protein [Streptomyces sp.]NUT28497.1 hypothetical protein [Streptomyces sp.]
MLSATLLGGALMMGAGTASAAADAQSVAQAPTAHVQVGPIEEQRSMCTVYKSKTACASLMKNNKMTAVVKDCLVKAGIGGAAAFVVGRYVSKDAAEDIGAKVVVAGAAACLASFS